MIAALLLWACRTATVVDACESRVEDTDACRPCASDADCTLTGNPCLETVYCAHTDVVIMVPDIGCSPAVEYAWPDASACGCLDDGFCGATED